MAVSEPLPSWVWLEHCPAPPSLAGEPPPRCGVPAGIPSSPSLSDWVSPPPHQRKAQITCTAIFIVWGVLVHLVIPPFVFMVTEEWNYIQGLYYSFITISTIGFGDFVAGESCPAHPLPLPLLPPSLSASLSASPVSIQLTFMGSPGGHLCPGLFLHPVGS